MRLDVLRIKTRTKSFVCIYILLYHALYVVINHFEYLYISRNSAPIIFESSHFEYNTSSIMPMSTWQRILFCRNTMSTYILPKMSLKAAVRTNESARTREKEKARHREVNTQSQLRKRSWWKLVYLWMYTYIYFRRIGKTIAMLKMKYDNGNRNKICIYESVCVSGGGGGNHCISSRRKTISLKFQNVIKLTNVGVLFCFLSFLSLWIIVITLLLCYICYWSRGFVGKFLHK